MTKDNAHYISHMIKTAEWDFDNPGFVSIDYQLGNIFCSMYIDKQMFHKIYRDLVAAEQKEVKDND